jgi:hypothetical protein
MKRLVFASFLLLVGGIAMGSSLDYDRLIHLDAEELAEGGIKAAYEALLPELKQYVQQPVHIEEQLDPDAPRYSLLAAGTQYVVYAPDLDDKEGQSWGRATWAFFEIVNRQLTGSQYRFYAINGGNDLGGMFLTKAEVESAKKTLATKTDWPYLPTKEHPWYGQEH